jgi:uncharacterized membrane protein YedE/YeeE
MMSEWPMDWTMALLGGVLIGLSVTMMLLFKGRVTGISGILYRTTVSPRSENSWRLLFILGLLVGGLVLQTLFPETLINSLEMSSLRVGVAGFLVGFGTLLGNGCTSGHGVCGISRFSLRSITATMTFMAFGILTVYLLRVFLGGVA